MNAFELTLSHLDALPLFPLPQVVFFPGTALPLHVFEERYRALTRHCLETGQPVAVPQIASGHEGEHLGHPPLLPIAGAGTIVHHEELPDGRFGIVLRGIGRVRLFDETHTNQPFRMAHATLLEDHLPDPQQAHTDLLAVDECLRILGQRTPKLVEALRTAITFGTEPGIIADRLAAMLFKTPGHRQSFLECTDANERLARVVKRLGVLAVSTLRPGAPVN